MYTFDFSTFSRPVVSFTDIVKVKEIDHSVDISGNAPVGNGLEVTTPVGRAAFLWTV